MVAHLLVLLAPRPVLTRPSYPRRQGGHRSTCTVSYVARWPCTRLSGRGALRESTRCSTSHNIAATKRDLDQSRAETPQSTMCPTRTQGSRGGIVQYIALAHAAAPSMIRAHTVWDKALGPQVAFSQSGEKHRQYGPRGRARQWCNGLVFMREIERQSCCLHTAIASLHVTSERIDLPT
ncbi:hypothetical protein C8Q70DRAFT_402801 [Cubamyces menziesii]|nr:hypothetical protein C8Q70DRAFT_402801 [Cubamyces menziesii]